MCVFRYGLQLSSLVLLLFIFLSYFIIKLISAFKQICVDKIINYFSVNHVV
jgi:hypothetical protein